MASSIRLKNDSSTEFEIVHEDGSSAKRIASADMTVAVDTIADFPVTVSDGDVVIVRDLNRGGTFIYDSAEVVNSNDGTNFNGWIRQYDGAVNVKWFGAKGDGITDDTVAIQSIMCDTNFNATFGHIYFPDGTYLFSDRLLIRNIIVDFSALAFLKPLESTNFLDSVNPAPDNGIVNNYKDYCISVSGATCVINGLKIRMDNFITDDGTYDNVYAVSANDIYSRYPFAGVLKILGGVNIHSGLAISYSQEFIIANVWIINTNKALTINNTLDIEIGNSTLCEYTNRALEVFNTSVIKITAFHVEGVKGDYAIYMSSVSGLHIDRITSDLTTAPTNAIIFLGNLTKGYIGHISILAGDVPDKIFCADAQNSVRQLKLGDSIPTSYLNTRLQTSVFNSTYPYQSVEWGNEAATQDVYFEYNSLVPLANLRTLGGTITVEFKGFPSTSYSIEIYRLLDNGTLSLRTTASIDTDASGNCRYSYNATNDSLGYIIAKNITDQFIVGTVIKHLCTNLFE